MNKPAPTAHVRLTRGEAAQQLSLSMEELDSLLKHGRISCRVDRAGVYFAHADLVAYMTSQPERSK